MPRLDQTAVHRLLPLSPLVFHILLSLSEGERHGYALKREVARRTGGAINPGPGVLYSTISKMVDMGVIEESDERPDPHLDDERRRYYRITALGRRVARAEAIRMRELVEMAAERFRLPDPA
jgi:DNA-binding PadR family transcriptional regulator